MFIQIYMDSRYDEFVQSKENIETPAKILDGNQILEIFERGILR